MMPKRAEKLRVRSDRGIKNVEGMISALIRKYWPKFDWDDLKKKTKNPVRVTGVSEEIQIWQFQNIRL